MTEPKELSVGGLFTHDDYIIPLYQRNYAWEQAQVTQLIRDIWDYKDSRSNYYIGSLIVHNRAVNDLDTKVTYETIDGQQRLTTLNILLSVLQHESKGGTRYRHEDKLRFDSRPISSHTLKKLSDYGSAEKKGSINTKMEQAYNDMARELKQLANGNEAEIKSFTEYLLSKVKILRVEVPGDTDLNHYFEIMNNRGEQLEKHEILKAEFLSHLQDDEDSSTGFAMIWDACSDMDRYMVLGFQRKFRDELFLAEDNTWDYFPRSFAEVKKKIKNHRDGKDSSNVDTSFLDVLSGAQIKFSQEEERVEDDFTRFTPAINFSNFLLHVLRLWTKKNIPLDDKKLISIFEEEITNAANKSQFAVDFAYKLLRARFMFDRYVMKREFTPSGDKWSLKGIQISRSKTKTFHYTNTFDEESKNRQVLMLLSMFHVSFPQIIYKHWLSGILFYLLNIDPKFEVDVDEYIEYMERLSDAFYFDRFREDAIDYYDIIFKNSAEPVNKTIDEDYLHLGTDVQNFIFNRLDYLIWKSEVVNQEKQFKIDNINQFEFSFRSSVEHYYPQHPKPGAVSKILPPEILNSFGNLCLISRNKNSELSNYSPLAKAEHYAKSSTIESLKQQLMMRLKNDWDEVAIEKHQEEMIELLME